MAAVGKIEIENWFRSLQESICSQLEDADGQGKFIQDRWARAEGGGGITNTITTGKIIEKGGVLFSAVHGTTPEKILQALKLPTADFYATGLSIVLHPYNPMVPIIHMNTRYFEMSNGDRWFGGGIDLTPHYIVSEDAVYFHRQLKAVCDRFNTGYYAKFKTWADDYFFIDHRKETRGIGGIFFDRLTASNEMPLEKIFSFVQAIGMLFAPMYINFMKKHYYKPCGDNEKCWQKIRRGRYVEFNLVYDKGTKFGLDTNGRTESILMSMPPQANWEYNHKPAIGSPEEQTLQLLRKGINWATQTL